MVDRRSARGRGGLVVWMMLGRSHEPAATAAQAVEDKSYTVTPAR
jgi:hypothetical protein